MRFKMMGVLIMPSLCGLLQLEHWKFSALRKVLFFLSTLQVLRLGAGANASRELSSYFELLPDQGDL